MSERTNELAGVLWKMATLAARDEWAGTVAQLSERIDALAEDVAAIREHLVVRTPPEAALNPDHKNDGFVREVRATDNTGPWPPEPQSLRA